MTPETESDVTLAIAADAATDAAGNGNTATEPVTVRIDLPDDLTVEAVVAEGAADGRSLTLEFGGLALDMDETRGPPARAAFTVTVNREASFEMIDVIESVAFGSVVLTLSEALEEGEIGTVSYDPTSATDENGQGAPLRTTDGVVLGTGSILCPSTVRRGRDTTPRPARSSGRRC